MEGRVLDPPARGVVKHQGTEIVVPLRKRHYDLCTLANPANHSRNDAEADPTAPPPIQPTLTHSPYTPHASLFASPPSLL